MTVIDKMAYRAHILLGTLSKVYGYEGFVVVKIEKRFIYSNIDVDNIESVFLEIEGKLVPFFIEDLFYAGGDTIRFKFIDYDNPGRVEEFIGCSVFLVNNPDECNGNNDDVDDKNLVGYSVVSSDSIPIGLIMDIFDNTGQYLLAVKTSNGKEVLLPLHDDLIVDIDDENKILTIKLLNELLSLNE